MRLYREDSGELQVNGHFPEPNSKVFDDILEDFKENYLDEVFGDESNLARAVFLEHNANKTTWIFESEDIRKRWGRQCEHLKGKKY